MPPVYPTGQRRDAPVPLRYGPKVVVAGSYLQEQETEALSYAMFFAGMIATAVVQVIAFVAQAAMQAWTGRSTPPSVFVVASVVWLVFCVIGGVRFRRAAVRSGQFNRGRLGEEQVVEALRTLLDDKWTIFRSLRLPEGKSDIDIVLAGPGGLYVIEVKNWSTDLRLRNGTWERRTRRGWTKSDGDPGRQARRHGARIHDYLERRNIKCFAHPVVALARDQDPALLDDAETPIWLPARFEEQIVALRERRLLSMEDVSDIVELLTHVVQTRSPSATLKPA